MVRHHHVLLLSLFALITFASWSPFNLRTIPEDSALDSFSDTLVSEDIYLEFGEEGEGGGIDEESIFEEEYGGVSATMDLLECCRKGNLRDLEIFLVHGGLSPANVMEALFEACYYGQLQAVKLILEDTRVIPSLDRNACLRAAIEGNHPSVVRVLLDDGRVEVRVDEYFVVRLAYVNERTEIVKVFLGHPGTDLVAALQALKPHIQDNRR